MDSELARQVFPELDRDEELLWVGKPSASREAQKAGCPAFLFGIPFTAFAIFWTVGAAGIGRGAPPGFAPPGLSVVFPLFGLIFVGIGVWLLLSPLMTYSKSSGTIYAVTNQRIIVIETGTTRTVKSYTTVDMGRLTRRDLADGSGDVLFAQESYRGHKGRSYTRDIGFIGISDPRAVEKLIRENFS
jgi:hypothetical protein